MFTKNCQLILEVTCKFIHIHTYIYIYSLSISFLRSRIYGEISEICWEIKSINLRQSCGIQWRALAWIAKLTMDSYYVIWLITNISSKHKCLHIWPLIGVTHIKSGPFITYVGSVPVGSTSWPNSPPRKIRLNSPFIQPISNRKKGQFIKLPHVTN